MKIVLKLETILAPSKITAADNFTVVGRMVTDSTAEMKQILLMTPKSLIADIMCHHNVKVMENKLEAQIWYDNIGTHPNKKTIEESQEECEKKFGKVLLKIKENAILKTAKLITYNLDI